MSRKYDDFDLDEYEHFEPEPKGRQVDEERMLRVLERALQEKKGMQRRLVRARQRAHRSMGPGRPPTRDV